MNCLATAFLFVCLAIFSSPSDIRAQSERPMQAKGSGKVLVLKIVQNISLDDLLKRERYTVDDNKMIDFLRDFSSLNADIKSISRLKRGSTIRLPLQHMTRAKTAPPQVDAEMEFYRPQRKLPARTGSQTSARVAPVKPAIAFPDSMLLGNISSLFRALGREVTVDNQGMKFFEVGDRREISLDSSRFPMINLHDERIILLDISGVLPPELRDIIEISWPEYRVVSSGGGSTLTSFTIALLRESGYVALPSERIVSGSLSRIEYRPDYLVHRKGVEMPDSDLVFVSVLKKDERRTPPALISWFAERGITLVELFTAQNQLYGETGAEMVATTDSLDSRKLARELIRRSGYPFSENSRVELSQGRGFSYAVTADFLVTVPGQHRKAVIFAPLTAPELKYGRRMNLDMFGVSHDDKPYDIAVGIMSVLASNRPGQKVMNSAWLTPENVRYRIDLPGVGAQLPGGLFFVTDTNLDDDLLRAIARKGTFVVKF